MQERRIFFSALSQVVNDMHQLGTDMFRLSNDIFQVYHTMSSRYIAVLPLFTAMSNFGFDISRIAAHISYFFEDNIKHTNPSQLRLGMSQLGLDMSYFGVDMPHLAETMLQLAVDMPQLGIVASQLVMGLQQCAMGIHDMHDLGVAMNEVAMVMP